MSQFWEKQSVVALGGTVFGLAEDGRGRQWLGTGAGIYCGTHEAWTPLAQGQPLLQVSALTCAGDLILVGDVSGQVVFSEDGGERWYQGQLPQTGRPVSWLAVSPPVAQARVLLAATDGGGIFRSTDGGRSWQAANAGLTSLDVLTLAVAPLWERREFVFAATFSHLYRSSNGGRAWQQADAGLEGVVVQSLAISPNFAADGTLFVGTEQHGVYRSTNRGNRWHPWGRGLAPLAAGSADHGQAINCFWLHPDFGQTPHCLAGAADGQIFRSTDGGETWAAVAGGDGSVMCFGGGPTRLYAGLHEAGLLVSEDGGQKWQPVANLAARPLTRLVAGADDHLLAFGPWENVYQSTDGGESWTAAQGLAEVGPRLALGSAPVGEPYCLLGTQTGLLRSTDGGQHWQPVLTTEKGVVMTAFAPEANGPVWAGTAAGELFTSTDQGQTWTSLTAPKAGTVLVSLTVLPAAVVIPQQNQLALAAATFEANGNKMTLWLSKNGGQRWSQWLQATADWPSAQVVVREDHALLAIDRRLWRTTSAGWQKIYEGERPLARLRLAADGLLALTSRELLHSSDGIIWRPVGDGLAGQTLQDFVVVGRTVYVLATGGVIWRCER